ncbi:MAG: SPASM domain-containing protein, partial [Deltaproteobacteria bacterium]|nr:SPASM domain-containing protein [Deltaproteobacteria bacterium]
PKLEDAVRYLSDKGITSLIYTNGIKLTPERFESLCQAGLSVCKVSCMGWDRESYDIWMSIDAFDQVRANLKRCVELQQEKGYTNTLLQTNHIIHDLDKVEYEKEMYLKNYVEYLGVKAEIWLAHNWAGQYENVGVKREEAFKTRQKRSCGRPLGPIIEIRAGGLGGKTGALVPCPYVLGMDSKGVMGHTCDTPLMDVVNGAPMKALREAHLRGEFDSFEYCKNCDQLYDIQESLVWTNIDGRCYGTSRVSLMSYLDYVPQPAA